MQPEPGVLFETDDRIAEQLRRIAGELRVLANRRRATELAGELDQIAQILSPASADAA